MLREKHNCKFTRLLISQMIKIKARFSAAYLRKQTRLGQLSHRLTVSESAAWQRKSGSRISGTAVSLHEGERRLACTVSAGWKLDRGRWMLRNRTLVCRRREGARRA
jgi:hypothetical protein